MRRSSRALAFNVFDLDYVFNGFIPDGEIIRNLTLQLECSVSLMRDFLAQQMFL